MIYGELVHLTWVPYPIINHIIKYSCGCEECVRLTAEDSLRHSLSRVNIYRALCSPSLICLTSNDPIITAFQLSWELRNLALTEQECKSEYMDLRRQCQKFAVDLLDQTRTSNELAIILNYDPQMSSYEPGDRMSLTRLVQAISYKQKKVCFSDVVLLLKFSISCDSSLRTRIFSNYCPRFGMTASPDSGARALWTKSSVSPRWPCSSRSTASSTCAPRIAGRGS